MRLTSPIRSFLIDKSYYIDIYENHIHVFHFIDILVLKETEIRFQMDGFLLIITGQNFCIKRLEKHGFVFRREDVARQMLFVMGES